MQQKYNATKANVGSAVAAAITAAFAYFVKGTTPDATVVQQILEVLVPAAVTGAGTWVGVFFPTNKPKR